MSEPEDNFIHSAEALNVLDKFQDAKMIIYVEGEDDIIFWASLFEKFGIFDYDIDFVGGIDALGEYMSKIQR